MSFDTGPYQPGPIRKVALPGENILLVQTDRYRLFQIAYIEPLPRSHPLVINVGAPAAGQTLADFNTQNVLDMEYGQLGQFRMKVLDDIHVVVLQPAQVSLHSTLNVIATVNPFTALADPSGHQTEVFIFEINRIFVRVTNPTRYNLAQARVALDGFRYILAGAEGTSLSDGVLRPIETFSSIQQAKASKIPFTIVPMGGWGR